MDVTPELHAAIERVALAKPHLRALLPDTLPGADGTLSDAVRAAGNGPATAAWVAWQAIEKLDAVWQGMQPAQPTGGSSADRP